jgi:UDP-N-acetylmuramate--alanine ligase
LPIEGITGKLISDAAMQYGHKHVHYIEDKNNLFAELKQIIQEGDVVITMGAGDIWKLANQLSA